LQARLKGALVTRLARPDLYVINTHPVANYDGDWSETNRFYPHRDAVAGMCGSYGRAGEDPAGTWLPSAAGSRAG
jgi:hypothetical protein